MWTVIGVLDSGPQSQVYVPRQSLIALVGEVSVLRTRLDTVERLLDEKGTISRDDIENFAPNREAGFERGALIREYILRVMRGPIQAMESLQEQEPPIEDVSRELKEI